MTPELENLLADLKSLLSPTDDGAFLSDEIALTFAIAEIRQLREQAYANTLTTEPTP